MRVRTGNETGEKRIQMNCRAGWGMQGLEDCMRCPSALVDVSEMLFPAPLSVMLRPALWQPLKSATGHPPTCFPL